MFQNMSVNIQKEIINKSAEVIISLQKVRDIIRRIKILKESMEINCYSEQLK